MPNVRPMRQDDVEFGLELCRLAGWNQLAGDWRRLLALGSQGMFIAQDDARPCGTAGTICYGRSLAWIGMILVHPDFRSRGIGSQLMRTCIAFLRGRGVASIKLDATDQGRPVYLKLGFVDERPIWRLAGPSPTVGSSAAGGGGGNGAAPADWHIRQATDADWPAMLAMDREAFGADRSALLRLLADEAPPCLAERGGRLGGFGFARPGSIARYLGPIVAVDAPAAEAIATHLLSRASPGAPQSQVFWDILPENTAAMAVARRLGFEPARKLTRMVFGPDTQSSRIDRLFGAAGFELG